MKTRTPEEIVNAADAEIRHIDELRADCRWWEFSRRHWLDHQILVNVAIIRVMQELEGREF